MVTTNLLRIIPERQVIPDNQALDLDFVIEINSIGDKAKETDGRESRDLNLCVVIDRSGSMSGDKIASAKKCCIEIVNRLSSRDLFSLVVFDDEAQVIVDPSTNRDAINPKIEAIATGDSTNIELGWKLGLLQLQTFASKVHINRLILLSDGQANRGETKSSVLGQDSARAREIGITTSTLGIGAGYQEDILAALAFESGGRFYNIQETQLEDIINEEFKGSLATKIERPRIGLDLPGGVSILEELNNLKTVSGKYRLRPILDNDIFQFAVRIRFESSAITTLPVPIHAVLFDGEGIVEQTDCMLAMVTYDEFVKTEENPIVKSVVQEYLTLKTEEKVIQKIDEGEFDIAATMLVERINGMLAVRDKLEEERMLIGSIEQQEMYLREIDYHGERVQTSGYIKLIADFLQIVKSIGGANLTDPQMRDFLLRFRKVFVFEHYENQLQRNRRRQLSVEEGIMFMKEENFRDILEDAQGLLQELLQRYPEDKELRQLNERFNEQLARPK